MGRITLINSSHSFVYLEHH